MLTTKELAAVALKDVCASLWPDVQAVEPEVYGSTLCVWVTVADAVATHPDRSFFLRNVAHRITAALRGAGSQLDLGPSLVRFRFVSDGRNEITRAAAQQQIESVPGVLGGALVFRGTRLPVDLVANLLKQGSTEAELLAAYPTLDLDKVRAARAYALTG